MQLIKLIAVLHAHVQTTITRVSALDYTNIDKMIRCIRLSASQCAGSCAQIERVAWRERAQIQSVLHALAQDHACLTCCDIFRANAQRLSRGCVARIVGKLDRYTIPRRREHVDRLTLANRRCFSVRYVSVEGLTNIRRDVGRQTNTQRLLCIVPIQSTSSISDRW